jgi:DNA-binding PadR family transcriptional regulator
MSRLDNDPAQLLPLSPQVFHILLALANGERHGYAIMQEIAERSAGEIRIGPGTLYGAIRRLLERGVVVESEERPAPEQDDERRRYYGLTRYGHEVLAAEARRLERMVTALRTADLLPRTRPS